MPATSNERECETLAPTTVGENGDEEDELSDVSGLVDDDDVPLLSPTDLQTLLKETRSLCGARLARGFQVLSSR